METATRRKAGQKSGIRLRGLKAVREKQGLSRPDAAAKCDLSDNFFWRLEEGRAGAGTMTIGSIVKGLKTTEDAIRGDDLPTADG